MKPGRLKLLLAGWEDGEEEPRCQIQLDHLRQLPAVLFVRSCRVLPNPSLTHPG